MNQFQRLTRASRVFRKTALVYLSKSAIIADIFLCQETDLLCIFNIVKGMMCNLIRDMSKMIMQSLKVQVSYYKTHRIGDIMLKNVSSYNLDIVPKIVSSQQNKHYQTYHEKWNHFCCLLLSTQTEESVQQREVISAYQRHNILAIVLTQQP